MTTDKLVRHSPRERIFLIALLSGVLAFQLAGITPGHHWGDDFAQYIGHARNIVEGRPYSDIGYIYNPAEPIGPRRAPPGLPLLLAPVYAARGLDLVAMKWLIVAAFLVALAEMAILTWNWEGIGVALTTVALLGFHPWFWDFKNSVMSDLPFLCVFYLGLWLGERHVSDSRRGAGSLVKGVILGVAWWAAYAVRIPGFVLPLAVVVYEWYSQRKVRSSTWIAVGTFVALAAVQAFLLQSPNDYLTGYAFHPERIGPNGHAYKLFMRDLVDTGLNFKAALAAFYLVNAFVISGVLVTWVKGNRFATVTCMLYLGGIFLWPYNEAGRYMIPLVPMYVFFAVVGFRTLQQAAPRWHRTSTVLALVAVAAIYAGRYHSGPILRARPGIESASARALFAFFEKNTPANAVVVFKKPRALALFTRRRAAMYTTDERTDPWTFVDEIGATYFAAVRESGQDSAYVRRLSQARPGSVAPVFANDQFAVYRLNSRSGMPR